tara:strand:- start:8430 stop:10712 length:2283 start_codon:yes stop_codon:yes gene_type:complete
VARVRVPLNNFQFGEVSPSLTSRTDTKVYTNAAEQVRNFFIRSEGGLKKRTGTKRIHNFGTSPSYTDIANLRQTVRIEPFIFSDDEKYIIAFSNTRIEIFQISPTTGAVSSIQSITSQSWLVNTTSASYLEEITFAQQGDLMFICHNTFPTKILERTGLTTFSVSSFAFDESRDGNEIFQPYFSFQALGTTITPSATSGNGITLTTSSAYFNTDNPSKHIGTDILIGETRVRITGVTNSTTATGDVKGTIRQTLPVDSLETIDGSSTVIVTQALHGLATGASIVIDRSGALGGISAAQINGTRTITVIDENKYEFTSTHTATSSAVGGGSPRVSSAGATTEWAEQSYSALRGYPAAVTFHQNRLWFGGTLAQPDGIWGSKSGLFFNFDIGDAEDNDALDLTANVGEIFSIRHLVSNRDLQIFTSGAELFIPTVQGKPVTPANAQIRRQTPFGSSFVKPTVFDGATLFIQKTGSALREFLFTDAEAAYTSVAVSGLAPHLILDPVQQTSIKGALNRSESYAFLINNDGTIAVFYSVRGDQKAGWSLWDTEGLWHSICSVHERLFVVCARNDGSGTTKLFLEEFQTDMPMDFCDTFSGSASVFGSLTSHFSNNAVVKATNGNDFLGTFTISGGQIDASAVKSGLSQAFIGYSFSPTLKTLPIDAAIQGGPLTGEPRQIPKVILDLHSTLAVSVQGPSTLSTSRDLVIRNTTDTVTGGFMERSAVTGKEEFRLLGYSRDPRVIVSQSFPLDLQINGMIVEVAF